MKYEIKYTNDLDKFVIMKENREVNQSHVKKLMDAINQNNLLKFNPILVDRHMRVLDGQHRLMAVKELKKGIYYIVCDEEPEETMVLLNTTSKNWSMLDYCNHWSKRGRKSYEMIGDLARSSNIGVGTILGIISKISNEIKPEIETTSLRPANFKKGLTSFSPFLMPKITHFLSFVVRVKEYLDFTPSRDFIVALYNATRHPEWDSQRFLKVLSKGNVKIEKCSNSREYAYQIEAVYNHRKVHRIKL